MWLAWAPSRCPSHPRPKHPLLFAASHSHTHNSSRPDFRQRKKEKNAVLLLFFPPPFLLCSAGLRRDCDSSLEMMKSNLTKRRAPRAAVRRGRRAFASREEKEQKPSDAGAGLNRCLPNCKGIVWLCVAAGWEEAGGRAMGRGHRPSHAGWGRPPATPI